MGELGNIFSADDDAASKPKGEDLYFVVDVPRSYLGDGGGFVAEIPVEIEKDGEMVRRVVRVGGDDGEDDGADDGVSLHLPPDFPSGRTLRLRRQGGVCEDGIAGDLYVKVELVGPASESLAPRSPEAVEVPPSLTPTLMGIGLFLLAVAGVALALLS